MRKDFELKSDVHGNVVELRRYLGSAERELSLAGLARILNDKDGRRRSASSIQRWEEGAEPDYESAHLMAQLAGVTFEEFTLGAPKKAKTAAVREMPEEEFEAAGAAAQRRKRQKRA